MTLFRGKVDLIVARGNLVNDACVQANVCVGRREGGDQLIRSASFLHSVGVRLAVKDWRIVVDVCDGDLNLRRILSTIERFVWWLVT